VIIISSLAQASCQTAMQALSLGAVEVLAKPGGPYSVGELRLELASKIRAAAASRVRPTAPVDRAAPTAPPRLAASQWTPSTVIAIGASTGGTEAIAGILPRLPQGVPGIVITQHIPAGFSRAFATRLNQMCAFEVKEAEEGDAVYPGRALIAPGDFHMLLRKSADGYRVNVKTGPRVCYQRPSVDVMFSSVAESAGAHAVGVLLTGMGSDGAQGLLKMRQTGARTIAQDEASCVVFGMPREAIRAGAAGRVVALPGIPQAILSAVPPGA
jgi:two-component system chemotaxis response regulator CheB